MVPDVDDDWQREAFDPPSGGEDPGRWQVHVAVPPSDQAAIEKVAAAVYPAEHFEIRPEAVAESFFATFKKDLINRRSWPEKNECRSAIFEWIEVVYNRIRLHTTIGSYAPEEFESLRLSASKEAA